MNEAIIFFLGAMGGGMAQPCADFIISRVVEAFEKADS